jgi:dihydroorotate dehydrogenase subfamily 2
MKKGYFVTFLILSLLGLLDSIFLTWEHYALASVGCPVTPTINCLAVTTSIYSEIFGIPLALFGIVYYSSLITFLFLSRKQKMFLHFYILLSIFGILFSVYLVFIQSLLIKMYCIYCLISAGLSFFNFIFGLIFFKSEYKTLVVDTFGYAYKYILKPILFLFDAEFVHENMVKIGESLPKFIINIFNKIFGKRYSNLKQNILGLNFYSPVGLSAGFDYEARLTSVLSSLGFGFGTIGTISNSVYEGNPAPRLGRLPKSLSLLVNKGFKNLGIVETLKKLESLKFKHHLGVSIGRTNSAVLDTNDKSIIDVIEAFKKVKKLKLNNSYYELNISCPNLINSVNVKFYDLKVLEKLLTEVDKLNLEKPVFVKMPIDQTENYTLQMLKVIEKHKIKGVIFGNLQTNKNHPSLNKEEVNQFKMGKYSGKPTFEASNALIKLAFKNFRNRFVIIGTGGIFNADDAWIKITNGASLVQLITGMIFEGPQLIAQINRDLSEIVKQKGFKNIRDAVGSAV